MLIEGVLDTNQLSWPLLSRIWSICTLPVSSEHLGEQILDGDYRQDCTKTTPTQGLPHGSNLSTSNIIIICLGVVVAISVGLIIKFWRRSIARRREFLIINSGLDNVQLDKY